MASFDELAVDNPNIGEQYQTWRDLRTTSGEDPSDYHAFREHLLSLVCPIPDDEMIVEIGTQRHGRCFRRANLGLAGQRRVARRNAQATRRRPGAGPLPHSACIRISHLVYLLTWPYR